MEALGDLLEWKVIAKDSLKPKETIEDIITHTAKDYTIQDAKKRKVEFVCVTFPINF